MLCTSDKHVDKGIRLNLSYVSVFTKKQTTRHVLFFFFNSRVQATLGNDYIASSRPQYSLSQFLTPFPSVTITSATMSGRIKRKAAETATSTPKKARAITSFFTPSGGSVSSSSSSPLPKSAAVSKFDKLKWISKLSDEQRSLLSLEINTMHDSWLGALKEELVTPDFLSLKRFLQGEKEKGKRVYPPEEDIYSW